MSEAKFAVYVIPPAESEFYQRGSEILGYDVRAGAFLPKDNPSRRALPEFDEAWIKQPQSYGLHVTTGYSLYYNPTTLPAIEHEIENVLSCFSKSADFTLTPDGADRIVFWHDTIGVVHCNPDPNMLMLHTMLTAKINPMGTASNVGRRYAQMSPEDIDPVLGSRVEQYYSPYILDDWKPHFTLMMPYTGKQREAMQAALLELFPPDPISVESVCLLKRDAGETHYHLHREFTIADYPR